MRTAFLALVMALALLQAQGQVSPGRIPQTTVTTAAAPSQAVPPGPTGPSGAQYVQVSLAPSAALANNNSAGQRFSGRRSRARRGAQYVGVSMAPRRGQTYGVASGQTAQRP